MLTNKVNRANLDLFKAAFQARSSGIQFGSKSLEPGLQNR